MDAENEVQESEVMLKIIDFLPETNYTLSFSNIQVQCHFLPAMSI
jgi:hypothetical protein